MHVHNDRAKGLSHQRERASRVRHAAIVEMFVQESHHLYHIWHVDKCGAYIKALREMFGEGAYAHTFCRMMAERGKIA